MQSADRMRVLLVDADAAAGARLAAELRARGIAGGVCTDAPGAAAQAARARRGRGRAGHAARRRRLDRRRRGAERGSGAARVDRARRHRPGERNWNACCRRIARPTRSCRVRRGHRGTALWIADALGDVVAGAVLPGDPGGDARARRIGRARSARRRSLHAHPAARGRAGLCRRRRAARDAGPHAAAPRRTDRGRVRTRDRADDRAPDRERSDAHGRGAGRARSADAAGRLRRAVGPGAREDPPLLPLAEFEHHFEPLDALPEACSSTAVRRVEALVLAGHPRALRRRAHRTADRRKRRTRGRGCCAGPKRPRCDSRRRRRSSACCANINGERTRRAARRPRLARCTRGRCSRRCWCAARSSRRSLGAPRRGVAKAPTQRRRARRALRRAARSRDPTYSRQCRCGRAPRRELALEAAARAGEVRQGARRRSADAAGR